LRIIQVFPVIVLFTDFGLEGPYIGQMKAILYRQVPGVAVVDLFSDVPPFDPIGAAYLLAAYSSDFPEDTVFLCVVDPGVGGPRRGAIVAAGGLRYVGPDNGLFNVVAHRGKHVRWWDITWQPKRLSASFHGRDLFAPIAARLLRGEAPPGKECDPEGRILPGWPNDLPKLIYVDRFGNAMAGLRASVLPERAVLKVHGHRVAQVHTFSNVPIGQSFWYENANGLVEIAVNQGRADQALGLRIGDDVVVSSG
jgi:Uncharacterized conserved protein